MNHVIEEFPYDGQQIELLITYEPRDDHEIEATWTHATFFEPSGEVLRRSTNCRQRQSPGLKCKRGHNATCRPCLKLQAALDDYLAKHPLGRILAQREALKGAGG